MEDTLRTVVDFATEKGLDVLILVLMEDTLRESKTYESFV